MDEEKKPKRPFSKKNPRSRQRHVGTERDK